MEEDIVPVIVTGTPVQEELQQHEDENEEEFQWIEDRFDALQAAQTAVATELAATAANNRQQIEALMLTMSQNQEQSRTMISSLTELLNSALTNLTSLSEAVSLKSIQPDLTSSSPTTEVLPEATITTVLPVQDNDGSVDPTSRKRRPRI